MLSPTRVSACGLALLAALGHAPARPATAQAPHTRAERTDYRETSRYADVLAFLDGVADGGGRLQRTTFGYSVEGRALPLVVAGTGLADAGAAAVSATGRTRVLLLANIHGGEVEGKEALQMLLRSIAAGERDAWLDSMVLLVAPIYNADGNERVSPLNRARQHGPPGGVGIRENAQGLDLNRDNMKLRSPEARSLAALLTAYDPHVLVDLHTTNGTRHAYHLTYAPPLHPDTDSAIVGYLRETWLPAVERGMRERHGFETYYYGNAYAPPGGERAWYTFDHRPRFTTNYAGLRNRFGILSEAYSYASFADRVAATAAFVEEVLSFVHAHGAGIRARTEAADAARLEGGGSAVRATFHRDGEVEILMGATETRLSPFSGRRYEVRLDSVRPERLPEYGTFRATTTTRVPGEYVIPGTRPALLDLLRLHGIEARPHPDRGTPVVVERFRVDSVRVAEREYEGRLEREAFGRWERAEVRLPEDAWVVPTAQPLGRLVVLLLEPRSDDGAANWALFDDDAVSAGAHYPVLRR